MKKRKNKFLPLIFLLGILVALLVGYSLLSSANDRKEAEQAEKEAAENAATYIAQYDASTMTTLSYQIPNQEKVSLKQQNGKWYSAEDEHFPLDQEMVSYLASAISSISVVATVSEGEAADYGLDAPTHVIEVAYEDGSAHTYRVGSHNLFNEAYYFSMDDAIYMISPTLLSCFAYGIEDLMDLDAIPYSDWSDTTTISSITVQSGGYANTVDDTEGIEGLIAAINDIHLDDWYDYYADAEEKSAYGLDGSVSVTVKYKKALTSTDANGNETTSYPENSYTLYFGSATEDEQNYYICPPSSNIVYTAPSDEVINVLTYLFYYPVESTETDSAETDETPPETTEESAEQSDESEAEA